MPRKPRFSDTLAKKSIKSLGYLGKINFRDLGIKFDIFDDIQNLVKECKIIK